MTDRPDLRDLREEQELVNHPLYLHEREQVASLLGALRSAMSPADFQGFHRELFARFLAAQRLLEGLVGEKEAVKTELRAAKDRDDDQGVRRRSRRLAEIDSDRRAARAVLSIPRQLGDALAWTLLDFRRSSATVLGEGERVDRLAHAVGLEAEVAEIDRLSKDGVAASTPTSRAASGTATSSRSPRSSRVATA